MKRTKSNRPWKPSPNLTDEQVAEIERTILEVGKTTRRQPKLIATERGMRWLRDVGKRIRGCGS